MVGTQWSQASDDGDKLHWPLIIITEAPCDKRKLWTPSIRKQANTQKQYILQYHLSSLWKKTMSQCLWHVWARLPWLSCYCCCHWAPLRHISPGGANGWSGEARARLSLVTGLMVLASHWSISPTSQHSHDTVIIRSRSWFTSPIFVKFSEKSIDLVRPSVTVMSGKL